MPSRKGWITPDSIPAATRCRVLYIPDDDILFANISGALYPLTMVENWEQVGTVTPAAAAAAMKTLYAALLDSDCEADFMPQLDIFQHTESQGTAGGGITANTDTTIKFNYGSLGSPAGNVSLASNIFTLAAGRYLVDMQHYFVLTTGRVRANLTASRLSSNGVVGLVHGLAVAHSGYLQVRHQIDAEDGDTCYFWCRSNLTRATDFFGVAYNQAGFSEIYGQVSFLRLGDVPA